MSVELNVVDQIGKSLWIIDMENIFNKFCHCLVLGDFECDFIFFVILYDDGLMMNSLNSRKTKHGFENGSNSRNYTTITSVSSRN